MTSIEVEDITEEPIDLEYSFGTLPMSRIYNLLPDADTIEEAVEEMFGMIQASSWLADPDTGEAVLDEETYTSNLENMLARILQDMHLVARSLYYEAFRAYNLPKDAPDWMHYLKNSTWAPKLLAAYLFGDTPKQPNMVSTKVYSDIEMDRLVSFFNEGLPKHMQRELVGLMEEISVDYYGEDLADEQTDAV